MHNPNHLGYAAEIQLCGSISGLVNHFFRTLRLNNWLSNYTANIAAFRTLFAYRQWHHDLSCMLKILVSARNPYIISHFMILYCFPNYKITPQIWPFRSCVELIMHNQQVVGNLLPWFGQQKLHITSTSYLHFCFYRPRFHDLTWTESVGHSWHILTTIYMIIWFILLPKYLYMFEFVCINEKCSLKKTYGSRYFNNILYFYVCSMWKMYFKDHLLTRNACIFK